MSIMDTFDLNGEEIIQAKNMVHALENFPKTVLVVFSSKFTDLFLSKYGGTKIGSLSAGFELPIYQFEYKGVQLGFFNTILGGAGSAALLEELIALGAEKVLYFGSCGALDKRIAAGHFLIPTAAYRDEGTSYHYAETGDYLEIATAQKLAGIFDEIHVPYHKTKTWTTDAVYRETKGNVAKRKNEGCGVVEMECASVMAVGQFRKKEVYQFLYAADCLDGKEWDKRIVGNMPETMRERILLVALETAIRL